MYTSFTISSQKKKKKKKGEMLFFPDTVRH